MKAKRKLKVYYGHHGTSYKRHPIIRLAGQYLMKFDFMIGDTVEVFVEHGKITIENVHPRFRPSETDLGSAEEQPNRDNLA